MVFFSDRQGGYGSRADPLEKIVGPPGSQPPLSAVKSPGASGEQRQLPTGVVRPEGKNVHRGITLIDSFLKRTETIDYFCQSLRFSVADGLLFMSDGDS